MTSSSGGPSVRRQALALDLPTMDFAQKSLCGANFYLYHRFKLDTTVGVVIGRGILEAMVFLVAGLALTSKLWESPVEYKQVHRAPTSVKATQ